VRREFDRWLAFSGVHGPDPAEKGLSEIERVLQGGHGPSTDGTALILRGALKAMRGELAEARADADEGASILEDIGHTIWWAGMSMVTAVELVAPTDYLRVQIDVAFARAEVARLAGRSGERREALEEALELAERKGDLVSAGRARSQLEATG
jgi:hypothetical protein